MIMNNENEDNCPVDPELIDNRNANSDKSHSKQLEENEVVSIEKSASNCFTGALVEQIETMYGLGTMIIHLQDLQAKATSKFEELNIEKRILTEMHDQNRKLQENFYEREVLFPVFRYLIGIADRCRNETNRLIQTIKKHNGKIPMEVMLLAKQVIEARKADRIEIETCLEQFDVERFRCPDVLFNSKWQRCVKHISASHEKKGQISERLLPGYRRKGVLIRPECVNVFVVQKNNKGE